MIKEIKILFNLKDLKWTVEIKLYKKYKYIRFATNTYTLK